VEEVRDDSRQVQAGDLFVAVPGTNWDGAAFIGEARARGAVAIVAEAGVPGATVEVREAREALAGIAANRRGRPAGRLIACGITGTNGKTTTCYLLESILMASGAHTGVTGTVTNRFAGRLRKARVTTPGALELQALLAEMVEADCSHAVIEVSSHALDQERVAGIPFRVAGFTNLTQDHLDHHGTMEAYACAKARLFERHLDLGGTAVLNADAHGSDLMQRAAGSRRVLRCSVEGRDDADFTVRKADFGAEGVSAELEVPGGRIALKSCLLGRFNLSNIVLAAGMAWALDLPAGAIEAGIAALRGVPGRLEPIATGHKFAVLVDYAHTPDAIQRALSALRPLCRGRLIVVFGCGGDRDRAKRPLMGEAAGRGADLVVLTSDNPRTEDPRQIMADAEAGIRRARGAGWTAIPDRRQAIRSALEMGRSGDVVLIAGKGHEDYQVVGTERRPFDDREEVLAALA
jgi:UDP-N-acetylmuramoyl-L-alanyl-D-glutamate--2,6-diaminopimelate ligase